MRDGVKLNEVGKDKKVKNNGPPARSNLIWEHG